MRRLWLIADDFGLAPGVSDGILSLIEQRRISGTGCMTVVPTWTEDARRLEPLAGKAAVGLHATLTDQPALTAGSSLAPQGRLPTFRRLAAAIPLGAIARADIHAELDAQLDRFVQAFGREPDFIDGHQHVHFLPPVRAWLAARFAGRPAKPWLRGGPTLSLQSPGKTAVIAALARGFDGEMRRAGFAVVGPLAGIYDWRRPDQFESVLSAALERLPDGALFMCHPGRIDAILTQRDAMVDARPVELETLLSERFPENLSTAGASIAGLGG